MSFASYAASWLKRAPWASLSKPSIGSEIPAKLTNVGHSMSSVPKAPDCWRIVDEYEEREREKQQATQYWHYAPAPIVSSRLLAKPAPAPVSIQRAPIQPYFSGPSRHNAPRPTYSSAPAAPMALFDASPIEDHVERKKFIDEKLASILGPERMNFQQLPSGHSGIDPVIAQHNQNVFVQNVFNQVDAYQAEQRRIAEERQRQAQCEEAERLRVSILLDHYRAEYLEQVAALAKFGPQLNDTIDQLSTAMESEIHHHHIPGLVAAMMSQIFEPAQAVIKEMNEKIPLEENGSVELKAAWPLERLEKVLLYLHEQPNLARDFQNLGQAIEVTGKYISQLTPFTNPLEPTLQPFHTSYQTDTGGSAGNNFMSSLTTDNMGGLQAPEAPVATSCNNFASLAEMAKAQKEDSAAVGHNTTSPSINVTPPTPVVGSGSANMEELTHHLTIQFYELEYNVKDLITGSGEISSERRREIATVLKTALELAKGSTAFLGSNEHGNFKAQVDRVISKIANLRKKKSKQTTELDGLAQQVKKFWQ